MTNTKVSTSTCLLWRACDSAYLHRRYTRFDGKYAQPSFDVPFLGRNLILRECHAFYRMRQDDHFNMTTSVFRQEIWKPSRGRTISNSRKNTTLDAALWENLPASLGLLFAPTLNNTSFHPATQSFFFLLLTSPSQTLTDLGDPPPRIPNNHRYPSRFACTNCITTLSGLMRKTHASSITRRLSFHYRPSRNSKLHALLRHFWAALSLLWV